MPKKSSLFYRLICGITRILIRSFYHFRIYGWEHYVSGRALIAANHCSYLDPMIVGSFFPEPIHFLARSTLFSSLIGRIISRLNSHPVNPSFPMDAMKRVISLLKEGKKILLFPEGSRSNTGQLREIRPGIAHLMVHERSTILPIYISGTFDVWPRSRKWPRPWGRIAMVIGSPIEWDVYAHLSRREAEKSILQDLDHKFHQLKEWFDAGDDLPPP